MYSLHILCHCSPQTSAFETVLEHVSECRAICQRLGRAPAPSDSSSDPTPSLLSLYEFEARLHLGHPNLETVIEDVSKVPGTEPKTFETIAGAIYCFGCH